MGSDVFKRDADKEGGSRKKRMKIDSSDREVRDMDIDSGKL
jgi:hypothetical protein